MDSEGYHLVHIIKREVPQFVWGIVDNNYCTSENNIAGGPVGGHYITSYENHDVIFRTKTNFSEFVFPILRARIVKLNASTKHILKLTGLFLLPSVLKNKSTILGRRGTFL